MPSSPSSGQPQAVVETEEANNPLATYQSICSQLQTHCNSGVQTLLPQTQESLRSVRHLDFGQNYVGRKGLRPILWTIFQFCPELESLDLSRNYLSNESVEELFLLLCERNDPSLDMGEGAALKGGGAESISTAASSTTSTTRRHWNGRPTVRHPLQFASSSSTLSKLPFRYCPKLSWINLSGNPISNPSGKLLSRLANIRGATLKSILVDQTLMNPGLSKLIQQKCGGVTAPPRGVQPATPVPMARKAAQAPVATAVEGRSGQHQVPALSGLRVLSVAMDEDRAQATSQPPSAHAQSEQPSDAATHSIVRKSQRSSGSVGSDATAPTDGSSGGGGGEAWSGMEALWTMAAVAAPPEDGWTGLATVMALVRQDVSIASRF